jgi:Multisubunit Na+/H+ antiporter, MnhG subunit
VTSRVLLIAAFLILTTPVGAHAIALAAWRRREPMRTPGAIDESAGELSSRPDQPSPSGAGDP